MVKKLLLLTFTIGILYMFGATTFAAPSTLDSTYKSTVNIINVTNPEDGLTTFKNHSVVSLIGKEGVKISLYLYDPNVDRFILYTEENGVSSWTVGPSGLFIKRIPLITGINYIGVYAELDGNGQFITRRVDRAKMSIRDQIKSILFKSMDDIVNTLGQKE